MLLCSCGYIYLGCDTDKGVCNVNQLLGYGVFNYKVIRIQSGENGRTEIIRRFNEILKEIANLNISN